MKDIAILIPAYRPDRRLNHLIDGLRQMNFQRIVVVDDGSGARYAPVFNEAWLQGARVLYHDRPCGYGASIKTGLRWLCVTASDTGVVVASGDGRHTPTDVGRVASELSAAPDALILGTRDMRQSAPRDRLWGALLRVFFAARTGLWLKDAGSSLRGLPPRAMGQLAVLDGEGREYPMNQLRFAARHGEIIQVPIATPSNIQPMPMPFAWYRHTHRA